MRRWTTLCHCSTFTAALATAALAVGAGASWAPAADRPDGDRESAGAWLGVTIGATDGDDGDEGVAVAGVIPGSPAERAGIAAGDRIVVFSGRAIDTPSDLVGAVREHRPGDRVAIELLGRDGERRTVEAELGAMRRHIVIRRHGHGLDVDEDVIALGELGDELALVLPDDLGAWAGIATAAPGEPIAYLGVDLVDPSDALREALGGRPGEGVLVNDVEPDSPAARAGLRAGDLIVAIDSEPVSRASDLARRVRRHEPGETASITYERRGRRTTVEVTLGERRAPRVEIFTGDEAFSLGESIDPDTWREFAERWRERAEKLRERLHRDRERRAPGARIL